MRSIKIINYNEERRYFIVETKERYSKSRKAGGVFV